LFEAIREACSRALWSKAVELTRSATIVGDSADAEHAVLRVTPPGAIVGRAVTLYLKDEDWSCDCGGGADGICEHVAAAVIALRRARQEGKNLPEAPASIARIRYLFRREASALLFGRAFVKGETVIPFEATLSAIQSGRIDGPPFVASQADLKADHILGMRLSGWLPKEILGQILDALADSCDARLDDAPVKIAADRVELRLVLEDQGDGLRLSLAPDPRMTESFSNGVALCGDTLRLIAEPRLNAREMSEYRAGRFFGPEQKVELLTRLLPALQERMPVDIRARKVPKSSTALPRLELQVEREGDALSVLPLLVYGDPAVARVDAGNLTLLGDVLPSRDEQAEERLTRRLQTLGLLPGHRERFEGEQGVAFAAKLKGLEREIRGDGHRQFFVAAPLLPSLEVGGAGGFALTFESVGEGAAGHAGDARQQRCHPDPEAVVRAWKSGASLVPLLEGGFAPLPTDWLSRYGERIADLLAAKEGKEKLPASALPDLARLCEALDKPLPPGYARLQPLFQDFAGLPEAPRPSDLQAQLRAYQDQGVRWLSFLKTTGLGALLADDMGLGKTLQALCALELPALVVAPTSVVHNWAAEAARFRPGLKVSLFHGPQREIDPHADLTLTSYALLRLDQDLLAAREWGTVLLDEAQAIKNPDSQVAHAAYRLNARFRVAMTGTPVENRLEELWSQLHFLNPGLLGGRSDFEARYARPIASGEAGAAARLRERIRPFVLRRLKREVAPELPPRTEVVERVELSDEERTLYQSIHAATRTEVVERLKAGGSVIAALEALLRLRQACCHPALVPGQQDAKTSAKTDHLLETLAEAAADGHKALVFSQWTGLLDLIEPRLKEASLPFVRLDGSTRDRAGVVQSFQADDGPPVMLISLKAGGAGLNLTAADHVFLVDPWWNPAVEDQAADRAHRIGQERPVMVHRLVALGTVEARIRALQAEKRSLAEAALSGSDRAASLSRDDLIALLE
ncbi:MAG: DEAD/DEAH box helicase, partial [Deltaproteobacteria bacterium]|nr:DEAD/DEAH box helicase [Deltaproteobacteria bacterium]